MSQELLKLLERHRELAAAGEMVDMFFGTQLDRKVRHSLARASADGPRAEGASLADKMATAKFRVALMDKYGDDWAESPEWKAYKATGTARGK
jgi:hypothetical protein